MSRLFFHLQLVLFLFYINLSLAQDYPRKNYNWEENRKITYQLTDSEVKEHAVIIMDNRFIDYAEDKLSGQTELYITRHCIIRVNDDKGINESDRIYLPMTMLDNLVNIRARTISKDGIINEVAKGTFKFVDSVDHYHSNKIVALPGVETGCEVEFFYTFKRVDGIGAIWGNSFLFGTEIFQCPFKIKEANFTITSPKYLIVEAKSYNGFPDVELIEEKDLNIMYAGVKDIPPMVDEPYATPRADRMKVAYKLQRNNKGSGNKIYTWNRVIYDHYKALDLDYYIFKLPEGLKIDGLEEEDQIWAVDNYIKKNIAIKGNNDVDFYDVKDILKNKLANPWGILKLYAAFFKVLKIPFSLVITSDRTESIFDPTFIDMYNFQTAMLYFPQSHQYICPWLPFYRYGPPDYLTANNYGLFIESEDSGYMSSIHFLDVNYNKNIVDDSIVIDTSMQYVDISKTQTLTGYCAIKTRGDYGSIRKETQREDYLTSLAFDGTLSGKILKQAQENMVLDDENGNDPVKITTHLTSESIIEDAGNNYLLNIGWLLGKQVELYQKTKRESDVELLFPNQSLLTIHLRIPKGYRVKGLEDAKIDKAFIEKDQRVCEFISSYTVDGDDLTINAREYFTTTSYPKERYEEFRQVVDAAADFNKLQLVLEKE